MVLGWWSFDWGLVSNALYMSTMSEIIAKKDAGS